MIDMHHGTSGAAITFDGCLGKQVAEHVEDLRSANDVAHRATVLEYIGIP